MEATFLAEYPEQTHLGRALIVCGLGCWSLLLGGAWILSREVALILILITVSTAVFAALVKYPAMAVYLLIVAGPFYDILRAWFFPGVELLGFWQDALTIVLWVAAIRKVIRHGLPKPRALDGLAAAFICIYAFSILVSANISVWFYGFRWFVLYPVMYLALRTLEFDVRQQRKMLRFFIASMVVSAVVGLFGMWYLGWDATSELYQVLNFSIFSRNEIWRWAATFSNPIIASIAFAFLFLAFIAMCGFTHSRVLCVAGSAFAAFCVYMTHSRSGIVTAAAGALAILFGFQLRVARVLLVLAMLLSLVAAIDVLNSLDQWDTLRLLQFNRTVTEALTRYPLGTGAGTAGAVSMAAASFAGKDRNGVDFVVGDSVALMVLRDTGWPGLLCYVGITLCVLSVSWQRRSTLVGVLTFGFWLGSAVNLMNATDIYPLRFYLWLLAALTVSTFDSSSRSSYVLQNSPI
jgi:hypothetical protein